MDQIERVRKICLALPEAFEQEAWGEPTFRVRKKLFGMYADANNHHGGGHHALWCHAPPGAQEVLVSCAPEHDMISGRDWLHSCALKRRRRVTEYL